MAREPAGLASPSRRLHDAISQQCGVSQGLAADREAEPGSMGLDVTAGGYPCGRTCCMRARFLTAPAGIAVLALGLSACSTSSTTPSSGASTVQAVTSAYSKTTGAGSSDFKSVIQASAAKGSGATSFTESVSGAFNYANNTGNLSISLPNGAGAKALIVGPSIYLQVPGAPKGSWYLTSLAPGASGNGMSGADPLQEMSLLKASSTSVTRVGSATIGGVATTEYHALLSLKKLNALNVSTATQLALAEQQLHGKNLPANVWVDSAGRVREVKIVVPFTNPSTTGAPSTKVAGTVTMTETLNHYGVPVHVTAPPAKDVHPLPTSTGSAGSSGSSSTSGSAPATTTPSTAAPSTTTAPSTTSKSTPPTT